MERVKQLMGFLLLATLLFLLWVIGAERGVEAIIWTSCFLLALSLACWMKGCLPCSDRFLHRPVRFDRAYAPARARQRLLFIGEKFRATKLVSASTEAPAGATGIPFTPERLESELKKGRTVFVDFTAAWCLTCKFNEATVLESAAVREAFQRRGIVKIKADWTNADPAITKILKQFGRPGVPLYVLYPGRQRGADFVPGIAYAKPDPGKIRNRFAPGRFGIKYEKETAHHTSHFRCFHALFFCGRCAG